MQSAELDTLTRLAYAAYGSVTSYRNYLGHPMPEFDDLGETIQRAWRAATLSTATRVALKIAEMATEWSNEDTSR